MFKEQFFQNLSFVILIVPVVGAYHYRHALAALSKLGSPARQPGHFEPVVASVQHRSCTTTGQQTPHFSETDKQQALRVLEQVRRQI